MRRTTIFITILVLILSAHLVAQGLFEDAVSGDTDSTGKPGQHSIDIGGHIKGSIFAGENNDGGVLIKAACSQLSLKLTAEKQELGKAFAELRLDAATTDGRLAIEPDLREAWLATYPGPFDIRLGKQIVVWGRADGINPTNNITPMNNCVYSSELDDTRLGNLLAQVKVNLPHAAIEAIWIPVFAADKLLIDQSMVPEGIRIGAPYYPGHTLGNCGYAARIDLSFSVVDGSISYFNGYETQPGFDYQLNIPSLTLIPRAYRIHAIGADFSTAVASLGLRGEVAAEIPYADYEQKVYVPNPAVRGVFGVDKTIGNWDFLLQYSGCYVIDFAELPQPVLANPQDPASQLAYASQLAATEIDRLNRLFVGNADKSSHAATARVGLNLLYETLHLELAGMYSVTTEDYAVNPKISYAITDAFSVAAGGRYLDGPDNSLNDLVGKTLSFAFVEMVLSF
jgi:hypothetical protein